MNIDEESKTSASVTEPSDSLAENQTVIKTPQAHNGDSKDNETDAVGPTQEYEVSETSKLVKERQEKAIQELMMKRRAAALSVSTNDNSVRARLRRLNEPITLSGERKMERRDRLRALMAKLDNEGQLERLMKANEDEEAVSAVATQQAEEDIIPFTLKA